MIKILFFILLVFALGFGFALLADMPGEVVVTVAGQQITVSLIAAAVFLVSTIVAVMLVWWIIKVIFTSPQRARRFFRARKRDRGYQSLSTGIIAAGAGDAAAARRMVKQAGGLLNQTTEPLLQLLDAQATLLEGDHDAARSKFEAMLDDPETRELGLRGLYIEAERLGDRQAQKHYAEKAAELAPQLGWAADAALDMKTASGDWEGAIRLLESRRARSKTEKQAVKRKRAVLLTAMAMDMIEAEPVKAKSAALEAHKLAPAFAPAAVIASQATQRLNDLRRSVKVLETAWRKETHPDVALAYVNARPGDSAVDRLKRARKLEELRPNNTDSSLIVAQMALEAGEFEDARKAVAWVLRHEPRESAYMLMADIEDAETGHQGKVREWLARAVRAPRDPAWTADGYVAEKWAPFSPVTGEIDAFEWKVPVEQLGGPLLENDLDPMQRGAAPVLDDTLDAAGAGTVAGTIEADTEGDEPADVIDAELVTDSEPAPTAAEAEAPAADTEAKPADADTDAGDDTKAAEPEAEPAEKAETESGAEEEAKAESETKTGESVEDAAAEAAVAANGKAPEVPEEPKEPEAEIKPPIPDDPGVPDDDGEETKRRGFRLF